MYHEKMAEIDAEADGPATPAEPELFVTMEAMKATIRSIAATFVPLLPRLDALEKKLRALETKPGVDFNTDDMLGASALIMAGVLEKLNDTLGKPLKPIYDQQGILIGAQRVRDLDS